MSSLFNILIRNVAEDVYYVTVKIDLRSSKILDDFSVLKIEQTCFSFQFFLVISVGNFQIDFIKLILNL